MLVFDNEMVSDYVTKSIRRILNKLKGKDDFTEEQINDVRQLVESFHTINDTILQNSFKDCLENNSTVSKTDPEKLQSMTEYENIQSFEHTADFITPNNTCIAKPDPAEPIYATPVKTRKKKNGKRVQLNIPIKKHLDDSKNYPSIEVCHAKVYHTPSPEKLILTEENIAALKDYMKNNLFNSTSIYEELDDFNISSTNENNRSNNIENDRLNNIENNHPDYENNLVNIGNSVNNNQKVALSRQYSGGEKCIQDKFVVNLYESRASKRWGKVNQQSRVVLANNNSEHVPMPNDVFESETVLDNRTIELSGIAENYYISIADSVADSEDTKHIYQSVDAFGRSFDDLGDMAQNNNHINHVDETYLVPTPPKYNFYDAMKNDVTLKKEDINHNEIKKDGDTFFKLKQEADVQCNVMKQASKAIEECRKSKRFSNSREKVTAEKILLLASYKHRNLVHNIRQSQYEEACIKSNNPSIGSVTIRDIQVPIKYSFTSETAKSGNNWFLLVATEGDRILSTEPVQLEEGEGHVHFNEEFLFEELDASFEIEVSVYHLKLRESSGNFNKRVSTICRSFRKLHYKELSTSTLVSSRIPNSVFHRCSSHTFTIHNLPISTPLTSTNWKFTTDKDSPVEDTLSLYITVNRSSLLQEDKLPQHSGFLTVGQISGASGCVVWHRRYCVLRGTVLHCYNDPRDEDNDQDISTASVKISLRNSARRSVEQVERVLCARPRTLLLETEVKGACERFFLSADSTEVMQSWREVLNSVVVLLRSWNELPFVEKLVTDL